MTSTTVDKQEFEKMIADGKQLLDDTVNFLNKDGKQYELHDWVTISEYCKRFNIKSTQTVSNWIKRGIVSPDNTIVIKEYNNIRLIKAIPYGD